MIVIAGVSEAWKFVPVSSSYPDERSGTIFLLSSYPYEPGKIVPDLSSYLYEPEKIVPESLSHLDEARKMASADILSMTLQDGFARADESTETPRPSAPCLRAS